MPSIRQIANVVTKGEAGKGVAELISESVADDLARFEGDLKQHFFAIGSKADGADVKVAPYAVNILIAGPSGSGKSTVTTGILERLMEQNYQICIVDPEGRLRPLTRSDHACRSASRGWKFTPRCLS